jgi:hypothetical protein
LPVKAAVTIDAAKFPELSRSTILFAVLADVAPTLAAVMLVIRFAAPSMFLLESVTEFKSVTKVVPMLGTVKSAPPVEF